MIEQKVRLKRGHSCPANCDTSSMNKPALGNLSAYQSSRLNQTVKNCFSFHFNEPVANWEGEILLTFGCLHLDRMRDI